MKEKNLFDFINIYSEYIVSFIRMHQRGIYAPVSACQKKDRTIAGILFTNSDDNSYSLSIKEVVERMELKFTQKIDKEEITSYVILYHSQYSNDNNHEIANTQDELRAITVCYFFNNGISGKLGLTYNLEGNQIKYNGFSDFDKTENHQILNTKLIEKKDYFLDRENLSIPQSENEYGLKVKKSNSLNINNYWCGIFGFNIFQTPNGNIALQEYFAETMYLGSKNEREDITSFELKYHDLIFKGISKSNVPVTFYPVVLTDNIIEIENKNLDIWENTQGLIAVVTANGKDTFAFSYLATDYAESEEIYNTKRVHKLKVSGIAMFVGTYEAKLNDQGVAHDSTMFIPSKRLPNYACFEFLGELLDFRKTNESEVHIYDGYILKIRLVTMQKDLNFFSLDIFVSNENLKVQNLEKGMKLTGSFLMQGSLVL
jgi:hypothetical protein